MTSDPVFSGLQSLPAPETPPPLLILAGGLGTRLRSVDSHRPKPMIDVLGKPFLHWLVQHLCHKEQSQGSLHSSLPHTARQAVLFSIGYKAEQIMEYPWQKHFPETDFYFVLEKSPLGTGGAAMAALDAHTAILTNGFWLCNGDTYLPGFHPTRPRKTSYVAMKAVGSAEIFDAQPNLWTKGTQVFAEGLQSSPANGQSPTLQQEWENVFFDCGALWILPSDCRQDLTPPYSVHTLLSSAMSQGHVGILPYNDSCFDIGTPARYERFVNYLLHRESSSG